MAFFHSVKKQTYKCKPFSEWVDTWIDSSQYKKKILQDNPGTNFIEIENYYVKLLSNWDGYSPLTETELNKAKEALNKFDIILIHEWLRDNKEQSKFLLDVFPYANLFTPKKYNIIDESMKSQLSYLVNDYEVTHCYYLYNLFLSILFNSYLNFMFVQ